MIHREIVHGAIEPRLRCQHFLKLHVKFHESLLHDVLGDREIAQQPPGIGQQRRFESSKDLLNRLPFRC